MLSHRLSLPQRQRCVARLRSERSLIGWRGVTLALLGCIEAALLWHGSGDTTGAQLLHVLAASGMGCIGLAWLALQPRFEATPWWWILGLAVLLRLIAAQAEPLLEDDHYRYLWDGYRTALAYDPYRLPPSAYFGSEPLPAPWHDILGAINNPDVPSIYGPVLQWLFWIAHQIAPGKVGALQALLVLIDLAVLLLMNRQRVGKRWLLAYAIHPLILKEAIASAHPDALLALWLVLALLVWQRGHAGWLGVTLALAVATKVAALVVVPLFVAPLLLTPLQHWTSRRLNRPPFGAVRLPGKFASIDRYVIARLTGGFVLTLSIVSAPLIVAGGNELSALGTFGREWRFNPLLYRGLDALLSATAVRPVAALLTMIGVGWLYCRWHSRALRQQALSLPPVDGALTLLLLLAPVANPWYWLWALAPAMIAGRATVAVVAAVSAVAYVNSVVLREAGWWSGDRAPAISVAWPLTIVQLLVLFAAWTYDHWRARTRADRR